MTNRRILAGAGIAALLFLAGAVPAQAAEMPGELTGRAFSEHVRMCEEHHGFDGAMNPGVVHQGFSNWGMHQMA